MISHITKSDRIKTTILGSVGEYRIATVVNNAQKIRVTTIGVEGPPGPPGKSAYQVAVDMGFSGSVGEWAESLVGPAPEHEIAENGQVRFKNPDGSWGEWITTVAVDGGYF